jgi:hypothetical protein
MAVGGTQPTLRKYLGALKDTTTVSLAKVNSDYKVKTIFIFHLYKFGRFQFLTDLHCTRCALDILFWNRIWTLQLSRPLTMLSVHQRRST